MKNTTETMLEEIVTTVQENYLDEDSTTSTPEEALAESLVETTDFCYLINGLNSCEGYRVHVTIQSQEESFEDMSSRFVVFEEGTATPIFGIYFDDVMTVHKDMYEGLKLSGVTQVLAAIEKHASQKSA